MTPITQTIKEKEKEFDIEFESPDGHDFMPTCRISSVKSHITQSHIALLESVVGAVESMEGITIENRDSTKTELLNKQDILTELQEALKELKK